MISLRIGLAVVLCVLTGAAFAENAPAVDWIRTFSGGKSIAVDADGSAYVGGAYYAQKLSSSGQYLWGQSINTKVNALCVDGDGQLLAAGQLNTNTAQVQKITPYDAQTTWYQSLTTSGQTWATGVSTDNQNNVYVCGSTNGDLAGSQGQTDAFLAKCDQGGNLIWKKQFGTANRERANSLDVDAAGNSYVCGDLFGNWGGAFLRRYDSQGNMQWQTQVGTDSFTCAFDVQVDRMGNTYMVGLDRTDMGAGATSNVRLWKYDASGQEVWNRSLSLGKQNEGYGVALDLQGNAYITGQTRVTDIGPGDTDWDVFVAKYDALGTRCWVETLGGTISNDKALDIAIGADNKLFITGNTTGDLTPGFYDNQLKDFVVAFEPVPEPATLVLIGLGGIFIRKLKVKR